MKASKAIVFPQIPADFTPEQQAWADSMMRIIDDMKRDFDEILKWLELPTTAAANPKAGAVYFNTSDSKIYVYSGSAWIKTGALT